MHCGAWLHVLILKAGRAGWRSSAHTSGRGFVLSITLSMASQHSCQDPVTRWCCSGGSLQTESIESGGFRRGGQVENQARIGPFTSTLESGSLGQGTETDSEVNSLW